MAQFDRLTIVLLGLLAAFSSNFVFCSEMSWRKPGCHKIGHTRSVKIPDCVEFSMTTNACRGLCESWALPSVILGPKRHPITSLGQCCNMIETEDVQVKLACIDGERTLTFESAVSCTCYHCKKDWE